MVTPRTCRPCGTIKPEGDHFPLCGACWEAFKNSGEGRRLAAIRAEADYGRMFRARQDGCVEDYITRVLAEREVERGRA